MANYFNKLILIIFNLAYAYIVSSIYINGGIHQISLISICLLFVGIISYVSKSESLSVSYLYIFLLSLLLNSLFLVSHLGTFLELDAHLDYQVSQIIMQNSGTKDLLSGYFNIHFVNNELDYPMLHFISIIFCKITDIKLFSAVKLFPLFFSMLSLSFYIMISSKLFEDRKITIYSSVIYIFIYGLTIFQSTYVKQSIGFPFFLLCVYFVISHQIKGKSKEFSILFLIASFALSVSHALSSFLLILFIAIQFLVSIVYSKIGILHTFISLNKSKISPIEILLLIVIITNVSYWVYNDIDIIQCIIDHLVNPTGSVNLLNTGYSFRYNLYVQLEKISLLISLLIIFIDLIYSRHILFFNLVFLLWSFSLSLVFFVMQIQFYRIEIFVWPFLILASVSTLRKTQFINQSFCTKILHGFIILFIVTNLLAMSPYLYSIHISPEYNYGEYRNYITTDEYQVIEWLNSTGRLNSDAKVVGAEQFFTTVVGKVKSNNIFVNDIDFLSGNISGHCNYKWIVFSEDYFNQIFYRESPRRISISQENYNLMFKNNRSIYFLYDNGHSRIFKVERLE